MLYEEKKDVFYNLIQNASREELIWMNGYLAGLLNCSNADGTIVLREIENNVAVEKITLLYATETGNAKSLATKFASSAKQKNIKTKLISAEQYKINDLQKENYLFIITSTQGDGEPPVGATKFFEAIQDDDLQLPEVNYAVLGLGDTSYPLFCKAAEDLDEQLKLRGAKRMIDLQKCDTDYEDAANQWFDDVLKLLSSNKNIKPIIKSNTKPTGKKYYEGKIITNINLNDDGSDKQTHHIEIEAGDVHYQPGDALGIVPENSKKIVDEILHLTSTDANKIIRWKSNKYEAFDILSQKLQLTYLPERVVKKYAEITKQDIPEMRLNLTDLLKIYPLKNSNDFADVLNILEPIVPRLYSISSSPQTHDGEVHLTVAKDKFLVNEKEEFGLCSNYLVNTDINTKINFYIHPNKAFRLPSKDKDIIMIGPGTGIAPFRSFLHERDAQSASGRNWLFFGERHFTTDFLYQTEIQSFIETDLLTRFNAAFSRDGKEKIYVQHKIYKHAKDVYEWIENGAYVYICGAKDPMSMDVENTLQNIIAEQKNVSQEEAQNILASLKEDGRLVKDVY